MAVGLPLKTTYADGDVYKASDVNDTNGTINSLTSSTLSYQAGKNAVINGGMDVWQRGTSFTTTGGAGLFAADRWQIYSGATGRTYTRELTNDTTNLPSIQYCVRVARNSGNTATNTLSIGQNFETTNAIPYAGKTVTYSFYARKGADYSAASSNLAIRVETGTGTDENGFYNGYTGMATPITGNATLTTTWQRFSFTGTIAATAKELCLFASFNPTGTAGAADYYEITGVQLELGSVATTFSRTGGNIQGELDLCKRYYYRNGGNSAYQNLAYGNGTSTTNLSITSFHPVTMRTNPTSVDYSTVIGYDGSSFTGAASNVVIDRNGTNATTVIVTVTGATQYRPFMLLTNNSTSGYLGFSAEL